jgi:hypothetical protein
MHPAYNGVPLFLVLLWMAQNFTLPTLCVWTSFPEKHINTCHVLHLCAAKTKQQIAMECWIESLGALSMCVLLVSL